MAQNIQAVSVRRFNDLIPFRIREVLLVSSPYDAFILQEDSHLTEKIYFQFREISLSAAPRFTHVSDGEEVIERLKCRRYDLILAMTSLAGMDVNDLGRKVKERRPDKPVVVLALDRKELNSLVKTVDEKVIDGIFVWTGDVQILLAIIKSIEDRENVEHDVRHGNVRVIIIVEDSPEYYSSFLGVLYKELMRQSSSLYAEGLSPLYRRMYMKSRPKLLHARSYEEGVRLFQLYRSNVLAVISDVRFPRNGELDPEAGISFVRYALSQDPELPVLLQSSDPSNRQLAEELGAAFLNKNSPTHLAEIESFLSLRLGFGDFIFRSPDGREIDRARDLRELEEKLTVIPEEQLIYHANHNHISIWLMARSEFELAEKLRPIKITDFPTVEDCRQHLIRNIRENRQRVHRGIISDFDPDRFHRDQYSRIGEGNLGGKGRGIAFLYQTLADVDPREFEGLPVRVPQTIVITTEVFDQFLDDNDLREWAYECDDDDEISERFLQGRLSGDIAAKLRLIIDRMEGPLAVRSSSLLEDSMHQPFAGIYSTLMIPNEDPNPIVRLRNLRDAVKLVYASTFFEDAKSYLTATGNRIGEEKMGVLIQRVVGQPHGARFYPSFSGVAQSHNYYPIGPQRADDGIAHVALGLGRLVVDGGLALRFSPRHPQVIPQFSKPKILLECTQNGFWALDMRKECCSVGTDLFSTLTYFPLSAAEEDGTLNLLASVYSYSDQQIRDDLSLPGPRIITFNNILKHGAVPLAQTISKILEITRAGLGCAVEVEFACDMGQWGRRSSRGKSRQTPELYLLQVRPLVSRSSTAELCSREYSREELVCASESSLGHGILSLHDIIYVNRRTWSASRNKAIAREIGELNARLADEGRRYILIGPGRWGTADEWLGIPVKWKQISFAGVIIEASPEGYDVEPSQGTHFFHNITAQGIGYLTLPPRAEKTDSSEYFLDWDWLDRQSACTNSRYLRHLRFDQPLTVILDGRQGSARIARPGS